MNDFLSVIVVSYEMERELPRTLFCLAPPYQRGITSDAYEVIVVDNGSSRPPVRADFAKLDLDLTILTTPNASPSPVAAINRGLNRCSGSVIAVFIDGARMASPGLLRSAREALAVSPRAVVGTRGRYLGHEFQRDSIAKGYDRQAEDQLLERVSWWRDGYRLFNASVFDESSGPTWFSAVAESNSLFMRREMWAELGGYDPAFTSPGGGVVNLDTWSRACRLPDARPIVLLGEATFHQIHGGVATNGTTEVIDGFFEEYRSVRGREFDFTPVPLTYHGNFVVHPLPDEFGVMVPEREPRAVSRQRSAAERWMQRFPPRWQRTLRNASVLASATVRRGSRSMANRRHEDNEHERLVAESPLFDADWYAANYPDVATSGLEPHVHYLRSGTTPPRLPGPLFDAVWYTRANIDVALSGMNPLLHYLLHGRDEGRQCVPLYYE